jgi:hypothetical protein
MSENEESTTFQIVKQEIGEGKEHPLKHCIECNGYNIDCKNYVMKNYYK